MESVTGYFSQKTVDEVKAIKLKTLSDIEKKKEDLRQMVGERYRDLIEAADTIGCMQSSAEDTASYVKKIQEFYVSHKAVKTSLTSRNKQLQEKQEFKRYLEIAAETKVLTEMPEKIWTQVELGNMTNASFLYLQSLSITRNLSLEHGNSYSPILQWFPMLGQQAQAVVNLRAAIVKKCYHRLHDFKIAAESVTDAICSITMLEGCSLDDVLKRFLDARESVLETILEGGKVGHNSSYSTAASKTLICDSIECIMQTVVQVKDLLCDPIGSSNDVENEGSVVSKLLASYVARSGTACLKQLYGNVESSEVWSRHLPVDTTSKLVRITENDRRLHADTVEKACSAWLVRCRKLLTSGVRKLLNFVTSTKDLVMVRQSAKEVLKIGERAETAKDDEKWMVIDDEDEGEVKSKWSMCCSAVFGRHVDLWTETLQCLFVEKITKIVEETYSKLRTISQQMITPAEASDQAANGCGCESSLNLSSYLWTEHDNDVTADMAWEQWQTRRGRSGRALVDQGGLTLKTMNVTPRIRDTCSSINNVVLKLLNDVAAYVGSSEEDRAEAGEISGALKSATFSFLDAFVAMLSKELEGGCALEHALFLHFLTSNLFKLCTAFRRCCFADLNTSTAGIQHHHHHHRRLSSLASTAEAVEVSDDERRWKATVARVNGESRAFIKLWRDRLLDDTLADFSRALLASRRRPSAFARSFAGWERIAVREEGEDGKVIESHIHLPSSTSVPAHQLLFRLTHFLQRFGAHSLGRCALRRLSAALLLRVLAAFSKTRDDRDAPPSQTWALQMLFDARYLHQILHHDAPDPDDDDDEKESGSCTYGELIEWLESCVDPFDLDVFAPHLAANIDRFVARTSALFAILAPADKLASAVKLASSSSSSSASVGGGGKNSHNVLPLVADCGRFSLLPVAVSSLAQQQHQKLAARSSAGRQRRISEALRGLADSSSSTSSSVTGDGGAGKTSSSSLYSKLGALSSSWLSMSSSFIDD